MSDSGDVAQIRLDEAARRIVEGVSAHAAPWIRAEAMRVVDAWGQLDSRERAQLARDVGVAASRATRRVVGELSALFSVPVREQRTTPLSVVRSILREPTTVLAAAGVPEVQRDGFATRAFPSDVYGLVPADLGALGDPDLAAVHVVWGLAKAEILRADFTQP